MKIGVFDSGVGGASVARAIEQALPDHTVLFRNDVEHLPYGTKTNEEILDYCAPILLSLQDDGCACIVVACNTVSTNLIEPLRKLLDVPLIAIEPMIKPAAQATKTGKIIVCATPRTLASERYATLKSTFAANIEVIEPDCSDWSSLIEHDKMSSDRIRRAIEPGLHAGADQIVLGCTHYHWIEEDVRELADGHASVLQPEQAVVRQLDAIIQSVEE